MTRAWTRRYIRLLPTGAISWGKHRQAHTRQVQLDDACSVRRAPEAGRPFCFIVEDGSGKELLTLQARDEQDLQQWVLDVAAVLLSLGDGPA